MTRDDIITLPNPHLRERSQKVGLITPEIRSLIGGMESATISWEESRSHEVGVALAATQINKLLRIVVIRNDFDNKEDKTFTAFINPKIKKYEGVLVEDYEGCLSVPDIYGKVKRYEKVRVEFLGIDGKIHHLTANGFLARVFQHEIDHTNGKLFIDHIKDTPEAFYRLNEEGKLEPVNYEHDVKNNRILW